MATIEGCTVRNVDGSGGLYFIAISKQLKLPDTILQTISTELSNCSNSDNAVSGNVEVCITYQPKEGESEDDMCRHALNETVVERKIARGAGRGTGVAASLLVDACKNIITTNDEAEAAAYAIGASYLLHFLGIIDQENRSLFINEIYELNKDIEGEIITAYSKIRAPYELAISVL